MLVVHLASSQNDDVSSLVDYLHFQSTYLQSCSVPTKPSTLSLDPTPNGMECILRLKSLKFNLSKFLNDY